VVNRLVNLKTGRRTYGAQNKPTRRLCHVICIVYEWPHTNVRGPLNSIYITRTRCLTPVKNTDAFEATELAAAGEFAVKTQRQ